MIQTSKIYLNMKLDADPVLWDDPQIRADLQVIDNFEKRLPELRRQFEAAILNPNPNIQEYPDVPDEI